MRSITEWDALKTTVAGSPVSSSTSQPGRSSAWASGALSSGGPVSAVRSNGVPSTTTTRAGRPLSTHILPRRTSREPGQDAEARATARLRARASIGPVPSTTSWSTSSSPSRAAAR
ncbi:hypothetical protein ACIOWI_31725 [Streptomyces sp. NPDC087659]|uniref:hypothetical protein n=1 Tax=Streptomyces sp. NPDC087659 TaxID=3365801 RepID=UPI003829FCC9